MKVRIAIPSYDRTDLMGKYRTVNQISKKMLECTSLYVEQNQKELYRQKLDEYGFGKVNLGNATDVEKPREWGSIMDKIIDENIEETDHVVIMDDDLRFSYRPDAAANPTGFVLGLGEVEFNRMIKHLCAINTSNFPLVSIQYRQFCQSQPEKYSVPYQFNSRLSMVWCLNSKFFRDNPQYRIYRHSKLNFMNDYYFFLNLLVDGYPNKKINRYCVNDRPNAPGGISERRKDIKVFNEAVCKFRDMFPDYVTAKPKKTHYWGDSHLGVVIRAKKAGKENAFKKGIKLR